MNKIHNFKEDDVIDSEKNLELISKINQFNKSL